MENNDTIQQMKSLLFQQKQAVAHEAPATFNERLVWLNQLEHMVLDNEQALIEAVHADFGQRVRQETQLLELVPLLDEIRHCKRHLRRWMKDRRIGINPIFWPARGKIIYQPLGVVGIMGAWNYPISLTLTPLVNAFAAGNHAMIKPSEHAPRTAALLAQLVEKTFPPQLVTVVEGNHEIAAAFAALPFDHLVFTGSTQVGKAVMRAASENLTPVTLELGGKSPAIIHKTYPLEDAVEKILTAKLWNAGQTCIAPDYVLVDQSKIDDFVQIALRIMRQRWSDFHKSNAYTHMIHDRAYQRMDALIQQAKAQGASLHTLSEQEPISEPSNRAFSPVLLTQVNDHMRVMQEEIFGPILPIVGYSTLEDAIELVKRREKPLALYYFDTDHVRTNRVLQETHAGGVVINDCILHYAQSNLPFGGIGPSGMGAYHGHTGFLALSKQKPVYFQSRPTAKVLQMITRAPYNTWTERLIAFLLKRKKIN